MPRGSMDRSALKRARDRLRGADSASSDGGKTASVATNVESLEQKREEFKNGRIICGRDEAGKPYLRIRFSTKDPIAPTLVEDCSDWLRFGWLAIPLATGYFEAYNRMSRATIEGRKDHLDLFLSYLDHHQQNNPHTPLTCLSDLNRSLFNGYIQWLDDRIGANGKPYAASQKVNAYSGLNVVIQQLQQNDDYGGQLPPGLTLKKDPWPQHHRQVKHASVLSLDEMIKIYLACIAEMKACVARFNKGQELLAEHLETVKQTPKSERDYRDHGVRLAALVADYGLPLPSTDVIKAADPELMLRIQKLEEGAYKGAMACLYPSARMLVPFVVMLAIHSSYNADPLLTLTQSQIKESEWFEDRMHMSLNGPDDAAQIEEDGPRGKVTVAAAKKRARNPQIKTWPINVKSIDNPAIVLRNVRRMTEPIRKLKFMPSPGFFDRVFLFASNPMGTHLINGRPPVRGYWSDDGKTSTDAAWKAAFWRFREEHGLPDFTLQEIRATGGDILSELTGDDVKAQQEWLGQASPDVTDGSYTGLGAKERNAEHLGHYMDMRYRFVETDGKRDLRGLGQDSTHRAVTPGFECFSPRESPIPGQRRGKMCSAYPECPTCPMAAVNTANSKDLAYLIKLEKAMIETQPKVTAERWVDAYLPKLERMRNKWLPKFDPNSAVWDEAAKIIDQLPDFILE